MTHPALILAAHGSHLDPRSSAPVHAHARRLREGGRFAEVHTAFWKEEPALSRVLDAVGEREVVVVPVFIASGYFVDEVVRREMGLTGRVSCVRGHVVRYAEPVGVHPSLSAIIQERATEAGADESWSLALLGHGTPRNPESGATTEEQAARLREAGAFRAVAPVFLDDEPNVRDVFNLLPGDVVVVPFFVADGWHVGTSIPEALAMNGGEQARDGRRLKYARAVGTHPAVADLIATLAAEAMDQ